jgi:hypothetical protein
LLADCPDPQPERVDDLPQPVIHTLKLDRLWMVTGFPEAGAFVDVTEL